MVWGGGRKLRARASGRSVHYRATRLTRSKQTFSSWRVTQFNWQVQAARAREYETGRTSPRVNKIKLVEERSSFSTNLSCLRGEIKFGEGERAPLAFPFPNFIIQHVGDGRRGSGAELLPLLPSPSTCWIVACMKGAALRAPLPSYATMIPEKEVVFGGRGARAPDPRAPNMSTRSYPYARK